MVSGGWGDVVIAGRFEGFGRDSGVRIRYSKQWRGCDDGEDLWQGEWFIFIGSCWANSRGVGGREPSSKKMVPFYSITNPIAASILSPPFAVADNAPCLRHSTNSP